MVNVIQKVCFKVHFGNYTLSNVMYVIAIVDKMSTNILKTLQTLQRLDYQINLCISTKFLIRNNMICKKIERKSPVKNSLRDNRISDTKN